MPNIKSKICPILLKFSILLIVFIFLGILNIQNVNASTSSEISFQSKLVKNSTGNVGLNVTDGNYNFRFVIYSTSSSGVYGTDDLWHQDETIAVTEGIVATRLGKAGSTFPSDLFAKHSDLYLQICVDATGTGDGSNTSCGVNPHNFEDAFSTRVPITQVAFADTATNAKNLLDGSGNIVSVDDFLKSSATDAYTSGTLTFNSGTTLDINGDLIVSDNNIAFDSATSTTFNVSNALTILTGNTSDLSLTSAKDLLLKDDNLTSAVALSVADTALNASLGQGIIDAINDTWDAVTGANMNSLWIDGGDFAYLNTSLATNLKVADGSYIGTGASGPRIVFDSTNNDVSVLGAKTGFGTDSPDAKVDIEDASGTPQLQLAYNSSNFANFVVNATGDISLSTTGSTGNFVVNSDIQLVSAKKLTDASGTGGISFDGTGGIDQLADLTGSGRRTKKVVISAEYAGAALSTYYDGAGNSQASNSGDMTSDLDSTGNMNYYEWTSTVATPQFYTVPVRITLPSDFSEWNGTTSIQVNYKATTGTTTNNRVHIRIYRDTTSIYSSLNLSDTSWTTLDIANTSLTNWATAGQTATIYIQFEAQNSGKIRSGDIVLNYLSKW